MCMYCFIYSVWPPSNSLHWSVISLSISNQVGPNWHRTHECHDVRVCFVLRALPRLTKPSFYMNVRWKVCMPRREWTYAQWDHWERRMAWLLRRHGNCMDMRAAWWVRRGWMAEGPVGYMERLQATRSCLYFLISILLIALYETPD